MDDNINIYDQNDEAESSSTDRNAISPLEIKRIKEAINKSDTEKFHLFTRMMRIHFMLQNAVIIK